MQNVYSLLASTTCTSWEGTIHFWKSEGIKSRKYFEAFYFRIEL